MDNKIINPVGDIPTIYQEFQMWKEIEFLLDNGAFTTFVFETQNVKIHWEKRMQIKQKPLLPYLYGRKKSVAKNKRILTGIKAGFHFLLSILNKIARSK